ncbi:MAG: segregation/condensation protein A, partial [Candidatus Omnitrophica bacterium]|nr:segregation/condensation protein A [Candidatus Omnitrophota bacterium]
AATLMHIKSRMLLPPEEVPEEEMQEEDPRAELVKRLLEYKKFKEAADELAKKELESSKIYARRPEEKSVIKDDDSPFFEASIFDLLTTFSKILKEIPKETFYKVIKEEFTVGDKIHDIFHMLVENPKIYFSNLLRKSKSKLEVIVTFLAVLELIRLKEIVILQETPFSEIEIIRNPDTLKPTNA